MKRDDWFPPNRAWQDYAGMIMRILDRLVRESTGSVVARLLEPAEWVTRWARQAAERMVTGRLEDGYKTWRAAAAGSMRGRQLYAGLQREMRGAVGRRYWELIEENSQLISSLPQEIAYLMAKAAARRELKGERDRKTEMELYKHVSRSRARLIARTETGKASTALTQAQSENLGLEWYVWATSKDERVRQSHRLMDGVLVRWTEPPNPELLRHEKNVHHAAYQAGNIWNCRCVPQPLIDLDDVAWPHRVFADGIIQHMSRARFKVLSGGRVQELAAA